MIILKTFLICLFYLILCFESLGQISDTSKPDVEDSITVDNIIKIFPMNKDKFLRQSVTYFEKNSIKDTTYKNGYFSIYDFSFNVDKFGRTSKCSFNGNASTNLTVLRKKIMLGYCQNIVKKSRWDIYENRKYFIKGKYQFYIRVVKYKDGKYKLYIGNKIKSFNGYEILP